MRMRLLAAAAVLVSVAVHLYLWFEGYREVDVIGPAFLLNVVAGAGIAVLLVGWRHWVPPLLAVGFGLSTLGAFIVSAAVGLFGLEESWTGWAVWTAAASEVVAAGSGALLLLRGNRLGSGRQPEHHAAVRGPHLH
jgi:hypothetical protein